MATKLLPWLCGQLLGCSSITLRLLVNEERSIIHTSKTGDNPKKSIYTGLGHLSMGIPVTSER